MEPPRREGAGAGVSVPITPWTGGGGEITASLVPEVSNIREVDPATGLPTLSTRRANTTVRVKDGDTIVIGGLTLKQESIRVRKVPLLSEIPVLGELFKRRTSSSVSTELVIYLTPHIITGSEVSPFPGQPEESGNQETDAPPQ